MPDVKEIQIRCLNCKKWFKSPIHFGDIQSFDTSKLEKNQVQCPYCKLMTGCNKENMRVRAKDSGFVGKDTE